ncbi:MAG: tetratricopeptide repeat protein, partial [Acidobacteriota bacterium]
GRNYNDDSMSFCLDDGSELLFGPASIDEPATAILSETGAIESRVSESELPTRAQVDLADQTAILPTGADENGKRRRSIDKRILAVAILLAIVALGGFLGYRYYAPGGSKQIGSIAVMPFVNESGQPDTEYLSDGMTESLMNSLSQLPGLSVKARSSVFRYKGKDFDPVTVGKELGVQALLTGRLIQRSDDLTLYLELVDVQTGNRIWGDQYDRKIPQLIALQNDIARDVSQKLKAKLSGADEQRLTKNYTANVEAYQLYLKGRFHVFKLTPPDTQKGIEYFEQAIALDPAYSPAYVGLAAAYRTYALSADMPSTAVFPKAKAAAEKAVELDDTLAEAHAVLGFTIFWYDWDWSAAEKEYKRALDLNPNSADAHWGYAHLLSNTGRHPEALTEVKRATELEPLNSIINTSEGLYLTDAGKIDEALASLKKAAEINPDFWLMHTFTASAYMEKGMYPEAIAEARKARALPGVSSMPSAYLGYALAKSGGRSEAESILRELLERQSGQYLPPYHMALLYNGLGNTAEALRSLERGFDQRDPKMTFLKVDPKWNNLRSEPRFQALLAKMAFPG